MKIAGFASPMVIVALLGLVFCSGAAQARPFKVVTTFTVIADMAQAVAGDAAEVVSITKPGAEIHNYKPTPRDLIRAQKADLILWNGLNLELWFERFFEELRGVPEAVVSEGVQPLGIGDGPYSGKPNPHAWMSFGDALIYIENIRAALVKHDSVNAEVYNRNAATYSEQILSLRAPIEQMLAEVPEQRRWLVSSEGAFSYLARDLGLKELYLWPINADATGTPKQVRKVIDTIRAENISVVFSESTVSDRPAKQVARETGVHYGGVLYVDSLSPADGPVPSYLDLLRVTASTIAEGLSREVEAQ
ncbi:MAG: metal ABC transporter substrate-binding protein [Granulosicoccaceae bacterium]